jgi:hypothetical protein
MLFFWLINFFSKLKSSPTLKKQHNCWGYSWGIFKNPNDMTRFALKSKKRN